jgi:hypothetical protein
MSSLALAFFYAAVIKSSAYFPLAFAFFILLEINNHNSIRVPKSHDWVVDQLPDLFHTTHKVKYNRWFKAGVSIVTTSN